MSPPNCRYCGLLTPEQLEDSLESTTCHRCDISQAELIRNGQSLEICGEEFMYDPIAQTRVLQTITLCPDCHEAEHLDDQGRHVPCQVRARWAREGLI